MTAPVLAALERARRAWERSQPQTFLELGSLAEQPATSPWGLFVEGAEPDATADGGAGRLRAPGRPVRTPDTFNSPRPLNLDGSSAGVGQEVNATP